MFYFNLQPLLNHRTSIEKALKKELAESERSLDIEKMKLDDCRHKRDRLIRDMHRKTQQKPAVSEIRLYSISHDRLSKHLVRQKQRVVASETVSQEKRNHLIEAMKKRKVMDRLKEKRFSEYRKEAVRKEQVFMSEVAIQQFNRRRV